MVDATFVSFVPTDKCLKLRKTLETEDTGLLRWRELAMLFGSEFFFTGPAELARQTHDYINRWAQGD
jgi:hypothetical protein